MVRRYSGNIPKSGKSIFSFAGVKLCHMSKKKDKGDYLILVSDGAILRAYPIGTDRSKVIEDYAENHSKLSESYELYDEVPKVKKTKDKGSDDCEKQFNISMEHFSDGSCVQGRC